MKQMIDKIVLRRVNVPFDDDKHFRTSNWTITGKNTVIAEITIGGITGYGEGSALILPDYCSEYTQASFDLLRTLGVESMLKDPGFDVVDGDPFATVRSIMSKLDWIVGHNMSKATVEMAVWDWLGKFLGRSLKHMLGGVHDRVKIGVTVGKKDTPAELIEAVRAYVEQGFGRVKVKIGPGHDVDLIRALRREYPGLALQVDANSAYRLGNPDHVAVLKELDEFNLLLIEQPLDPGDIIDHGALAQLLTGQTPLCLDESIHSLHDARLADALGAARVLNIKQGRVGGITVAKQIHDFWAVELSREVWGGGMYETSLGLAANAALASLPGYSPLIGSDMSMSDKYRPAEYDIATPFYHDPDDSTVTVPTGPGLGVEINHEMLDRWTLEKVEFRTRDFIRS